MNDDEPRIRVLAADDQRVVREGIAMILSLLPDVEVVGTAADGEEALALAGKWRPDVVLMDLRMPRLDGVEATRRLRAEFPDIRVIALTTYADDRSVVSALRAGAVGYLTKDAGAEEIRQALLRVTSGQPVIDPAVQRHLVEAIAAGPPSADGDPAPASSAAVPPTASASSGTSAGPADVPKLPDGLTPREVEVLSLIAAGLSNAEIAVRLVVTEATVKVTSTTCSPRSASATVPRLCATPTGTAWHGSSVHPGYARLATGAPASHILLPGTPFQPLEP